jgi:hypothetical protein
VKREQKDGIRKEGRKGKESVTYAFGCDVR